MSSEAILSYKNKVMANLGVYSQFENIPGEGIEANNEKILMDLEEVSEKSKIRIISLASYSAGVLNGKKDVEYELTEKILNDIIEEVSQQVDYLVEEATQTGKKLILSKLLENENIRLECDY